MIAEALDRDFQSMRAAFFTPGVLDLERLQRADEWLGQVLDTLRPQDIASYLCEILPAIAEATRHADPTGSPPEFFEQFRLRLDRILSEVPEALPPAERDACLATLRSCEQIIRQWTGQPGQYAPGVRDESAVVRFDLQPDQTGIVHIPCLSVRSFGHPSPAAGAGGRIVRMAVRCHPLPDDNTGDILETTFPQDTTGGESPQDQLSIAVETARSLAHDALGIHTLPPLAVSVNFEGSAAALTGASLGLGVAVSFLSTVSDAFGIHMHTVPRNSAVFTGRLRSDGGIEPIDSDVIRQKLRLVFFSPYQTFVFPKSNEEDVEREYELLRRRYSGRHLSRVSVRSLADVLDHRSAVNVMEYSALKRFTRQLHRQQRRIAIGSSSLLLVLVTLWSVLFADFDSNPASITVSGDRIVVLNERGRELWSAGRVGDDVRMTSDSVMRLYIDDLHERSAVTDLDGDGRNEVVLAFDPGYQAERTDILTCLSSDGAVLWKQKVGFPTRTTEGDYRTEAVRIYRMRAEPLGNNRAMHIIALASNIHYSVFLTVLSGSGAIVSEYLHFGSISDLAIIRTHSRREGILFTGTHNGFRAAVAGILDAHDASGACPQSASHTLLEPDMEAARELAYIRFPLSPAVQASRTRTNPHARLESGGALPIQIAVNDMVLPIEFEILSGGRVFLTYTFDDSLRPISVNTSSEYDALERSMLAHGKLTHPFDASEKAALLTSLEYWDGKEFRRQPGSARLATTRRAPQAASSSDTARIVKR